MFCCFGRNNTEKPKPKAPPSFDEISRRNSRRSSGRGTGPPVTPRPDLNPGSADTSGGSVISDRQAQHIPVTEHNTFHKTLADLNPADINLSREVPLGGHNGHSGVAVSPMARSIAEMAEDDTIIVQKLNTGDDGYLIPNDSGPEDSADEASGQSTPPDSGSQTRKESTHEHVRDEYFRQNSVISIGNDSIPTTSPVLPSRINRNSYEDGYVNTPSRDRGPKTPSPLPPRHPPRPAETIQLPDYDPHRSVDRSNSGLSSASKSSHQRPPLPLPRGSEQDGGHVHLFRKRSDELSEHADEISSNDGHNNKLTLPNHHKSLPASRSTTPKPLPRRSVPNIMIPEGMNGICIDDREHFESSSSVSSIETRPLPAPPLSPTISEIRGGSTHSGASTPRSGVSPLPSRKTNGNKTLDLTAPVYKNSNAAAGTTAIPGYTLMDQHPKTLAMISDAIKNTNLHLDKKVPVTAQPEIYKGDMNSVHVSGYVTILPEIETNHQGPYINISKDKAKHDYTNIGASPKLLPKEPHEESRE